MSKVLFVSNISRKISSFVTASISAAHALDLEFYHAANWQEAAEGQVCSDETKFDIKINHINISRNPFSRKNRIAYRELIALIEREKIDFIHCNTPSGGLLGRLVGKSAM